MTVDEIDDRIRDLERDRDQQRVEFDRLRVGYEQLRNQLRYPGTRFLLDLSWKRVYKGTVSVATVTLNVGAVFETLPGAQHALYLPSAYCTDSNTPVVVCDGALSVAPANTVAVAVQRQKQSSPTRIEAKVLVRNDTAGTVNVAVEVWRRLGIGAA